jgi:hypothetical protein
MKELTLLIVAIFVLSGVAFSSEFREFNAKTLSDISIKIKPEDQINESITPKFEKVFADKYLFPVNNLPKPKTCLDYLCHGGCVGKYTNMDKGTKCAKTLYFPNYFTAQVDTAQVATAPTLLNKKKVLSNDRLCRTYPPWIDECISWLNSLIAIDIDGLYFYAFGVTYEFSPKIWYCLSSLTLDATAHATARKSNISVSLELVFKIDTWRFF